MDSPQVNIESIIAVVLVKNWFVTTGAVSTLCDHRPMLVYTFVCHDGSQI